jgi:hypothetical protein
MGIFDYIKYDQKSQDVSEIARQQCVILEKLIKDNIQDPAQKQKAINHLEICFMYIGKGIRDDQIARNPLGVEVEPARSYNPPRVHGESDILTKDLDKE